MKPSLKYSLLIIPELILKIPKSSSEIPKPSPYYYFFQQFQRYIRTILQEDHNKPSQKYTLTFPDQSPKNMKKYYPTLPSGKDKFKKRY